MNPNLTKILKFSGLNLELIQKLIINLKIAQMAWIRSLEDCLRLAGMEGIDVHSVKG